jgi:hypothetical protein
MRAPQHPRTPAIDGLAASGLRFTQGYRSAADTAGLDELLSRAELTVLDAILDKLDQWGEELRSDHKRASIVHPVCPTPVGSAVDRSRCVARRALYGDCLVRTSSPGPT